MNTKLAKLEARVAALKARHPEPEPMPRFEDFLSEDEIAAVDEAIARECRNNPTIEPPTDDRPPELGLAIWTALSRMPARVRPSYCPDDKGIQRHLKMYRTATRHPRWLLERNHWRMRHLVLRRNRREKLGLGRDDDLPRVEDDHPEEVAWTRYRDIEEALEYGFFPSGENCGDCGFGWSYLESPCPQCGGEVGLDLYWRKRNEGSE